VSLVEPLVVSADPVLVVETSTDVSEPFAMVVSIPVVDSELDDSVPSSSLVVMLKSPISQAVSATRRQ
jgi:hypothetical protein